MPERVATVGGRDWSDALGAAAVGMFALAAYTTRLLADVGFWDTAVFQGAAPTLGLTHPTGYPTYLVLGFLWTQLLPMLQPAHALNLLAAVTAAGSVSLAFLLARRIGAGTIAAMAGSLTVGLMFSFWRTASRADPHPLHVLLALAILLLLLAWDRRGDARLLVAAAVLFGLAMGNHMLTAMLAPGIGVYVLTRRPSLLRQPRTVIAAVAGLLAGLAIYAYVPIRAAAGPAIHHDYAPTTPALFLRYALGQDFSGSMGFLSPSGLGRAAGELGTFAQQVGDSLSVPVAFAFAVLVLAGAYVLLRDRRWRTAWLLLSTGGLTLYARLTYANADIERYAMVPMVIAGALAALGATAAWRGLLAGPAEPATGEAAEAGGGAVTGGAGRAPSNRKRVLDAIPALLLLVPVFLFVTNGPRIGIPSARCFLDEAQAGLAPDSVVVSWWSFATPIWYAQAVEGARPDVTVVLMGSGVAAEVATRFGEDRPIYLIQFESELQDVRDAGFNLEEASFCGTTMWRVTGQTAP